MEALEDRVYERFGRRHGSVLFVGVGAVGSLTAVQLAAMGFSPLWFVDYKRLRLEIIARHYLGLEEVGELKALALAKRISREHPCNAIGIPRDFRKLPADEQRRLVSEADIVVAATDEVDCQRLVNEVCLEVEKPAVFPGVWVDSRIRDAEVGEVLWVLPGRNTPCYECAVAFRQGAPDADAARGARVDIEPVATATAQVVAALLEPTNELSAILDPQRTAIYIHGLTPMSPGIRGSFPTEGLQSINARVPFPKTCTARGCRAGRPGRALHPQGADRSLMHWFDTVGLGRPSDEIEFSEESTGDMTTSWVSGDHPYFARYSPYHDSLYVEIQIAPSTGIGWKGPRMYLVNTREQLEIALAEDRRRRNRLSG